MINYSTLTNANNALYTIVSNRNVVLYYDMPILSFGKNVYGAHLISCLIDYDPTTQTKEEFAILVTEDDLDKFVDRTISLLSLMQSSPVVINKINAVDNSSQSFNIEYGAIPVDLLPDVDSICPEEFDIPSNFSEISLIFKGSETDQNAMDIDTFKQWVEHSTPIVKQPFEIIKKAVESFQYRVKVLAKTGSFKFVYRYELLDAGNRSFLLENQKDTLEKLISDYLSYLFKDIYNQNEVNALYRKSVSINLQRLVDLVNQYCDNIGFPRNDNLDYLILESVSRSIGHMNEINKRIVPSYDSLSLESRYPVILISRSGKSKYIEDSCVLKSALDEELEQLLDIAVYKLSTKTKKGNAFLYYSTPDNPDEKKIVDVGITIDTKEHIDNTEFTESLHKNKVIQVLAKKEIDHNSKKIKRLVISY
jgi:hypothetical protein